MLKSKYSPVQLGMALSKTILNHKRALEKPQYPEKKIDWIKVTTNKIIDLLEQETKSFNETNPNEQLKSKDLISVAQTTLNRLLKAMGLKTQKD
jgi:hypothetical protein